MTRASNPRLMTRVVDAVVHLYEGKGSSARDILEFIRQNSKSPLKNLALQVRRALKHAVNAGLLRHRSGRYKALLTLNPAPTLQSTNENNEETIVEESTDIDEDVPGQMKNVHRSAHDAMIGTRKIRNQKRKASRGNERKGKSKSSKRRNAPTESAAVVRRKSKYKENGARGRSSRQRISEVRLRADIGNPSPSSTNRRKSKAKPKDRKYYSDLSDSGDSEENNRSTKYKRSDQVRRKTPLYQDRKYYEPRGTTSKGRSASRDRSSPIPRQQQNYQQPQQHCELQSNHSLEDVENKGMDPEDRRDLDLDKKEDREIETNDEPNNCGSSSTL